MKVSTGYKIEESIHSTLVQTAEQTGISQTRIIENALREYLPKCLTNTAVGATLPSDQPQTAGHYAQHNEE